MIIIIYLANGFVNLVLDVRDVILQSGNYAHDLLALFLQPTGIPLGRLKKFCQFISLFEWATNWKYLSRNTGCNELVGVLIGWQAFGTIFFILAECCAYACARTLRHADVFVRTLTTDRRVSGDRLMVRKRWTGWHGIRCRVKSKNATQFVFGCV